MSLAGHWDRQYRTGRPIWDSDRPTSELVRVVRAEQIQPCRALELGCGTGANAVWLARQGFAVTAVDLSPAAIVRARDRAARANVSVRFLLGDVRQLRPTGGLCGLFVDCGCFGAVQLADAAGYVEAIRRGARPGSVGLVLTGNDREPEDCKGPPALSAGRFREVFGEPFDIVCLREFRFDAEQGAGKRYLGWSCLLRRKGLGRHRPSP
jgi:SAM-dependent methyltransferase